MKRLFCRICVALGIFPLIMIAYRISPSLVSEALLTRLLKGFDDSYEEP